ncbi:VTT domain-containing protein [Candidatus Omnitrophota bacterium]
MKKNHISLVIKLAIGLAIVLGVWWLVKCQCVSLKALTPSALRDYIQSFGNLSAVVYVAAYVLNTISVVPPIAPLSLAAGLAFGTAWGSVLLFTAAIIGTSATFMISRFFGRGLIEKALKGRFKKLDQKLEENGFLTVLFFRVIPLVPYEVLNYACGLSKIKFRDYFLATLLGLIPGVAVASFFGGSLGEIETIKDVLTPKFLIAVGLMVLIIAVPTIYKILTKGKDKKGDTMDKTPEEVRQMEHMHVQMSYNQVDDLIYGGNNMCCQTHFEEELISKGISADISLEAERLDNPEGVKYFFWLPWLEDTAPTKELIDVAMGVMDSLVNSGVKVYVHCKNGHGRTTTFLASYYIHKGMTAEEALSHVLEKRPSGHLNDMQMAFLAEYEKSVKS